jgi:hypothetical protein
VALGPSQHPG